MQLPKRVFSKGTGDVTRSIRLTEDMEKALTKLADDAGITISAYVVWVLDVHLQEMAEAGKVPWPEGYIPESTNNKKRK